MAEDMVINTTNDTNVDVHVKKNNEYVIRLEERLKEHKRKKQEQLKKQSTLPRIDETEKNDLKSNLNLKSFNDNHGHVNINSSSKPTVSTSPIPIPSPLPSEPNVKLISLTEVNSTRIDKGNGLKKIVSGIWDKVKGMVGFTPDCLNGGTKRLGGKCYCPQYFLGDYCEKRQCLNNGKLVKIDTIPKEETCKCPNPKYITGNHCEVIHCQNGGKPLGNGTCKCIDNWYTGDFCEYYAASWFAVLGIPLICIAVIALCCVICRLDFCPKRTSRHENRRRNRGIHQPRRQHFDRERPIRFDDPNTVMIQENLLNDCQQHRNQVVRLENIPVYNPCIPSMPNDEFKPLEPPPSYEQAVSTCLPISTQLPQPPTYTAQDNRQIPPPPEFAPPNPPSQRFNVRNR